MYIYMQWCSNKSNSLWRTGRYCIYNTCTPILGIVYTCHLWSTRYLTSTTLCSASLFTTALSSCEQASSSSEWKAAIEGSWMISAGGGWDVLRVKQFAQWHTIHNPLLMMRWLLGCCQVVSLTTQAPWLNKHNHHLGDDSQVQGLHHPSAGARWHGWHMGSTY